MRDDHVRETYGAARTNVNRHRGMLLHAGLNSEWSRVGSRERDYGGAYSTFSGSNNRNRARCSQFWPSNLKVTFTREGLVFHGVVLITDAMARPLCRRVPEQSPSYSFESLKNTRHAGRHHVVWCPQIHPWSNLSKSVRAGASLRVAVYVSASVRCFCTGEVAQTAHRVGF